VKAEISGEAEKLDVSKHLFRNTIIGWFEMAILVASGLVIPPFLLARLGKEGYGVWLLVGQVTAYLPLLDLGVSSSVGRFVAKYNARKDYDGVSRVVSSSIFLFLVSSIFVVAATAALWPGFSKFFHLSPEYFNVGRWLILLTGLGLAIDLPLRIGQGILQGIHRFDLMYLLRALVAFLKLLFIVILFGWLGCTSLILLGVLSIAVTILGDGLMCGFVYRKSGAVISINRTLVRLSNLREIWSLSLSTLLVTIATLLFNQGQVIGVGKIAGPKAVTLYALPVMLLTYGSMVIAYIIGAFKPLASHMQALDETENLRRLNIAGVKISFVISLFIAVMAIVFGVPFFRAWLHASKDLSAEDFTVLSNVLAIMVIGFAIGVPQNVTSNMLSAIEKQWFVAAVFFAASVAGFGIGIILMAKTALGFYGMAIGWAAVFVIRGVFVLPVGACRYFKIKSLLYFQQAYLSPIIAAVVLTAAAYTTRAIVAGTSIAALALCMTCSAGVYAIAVYLFCLDREQKMRLRSLVIRLLKLIVKKFYPQ
jgi:O-antigen/teichoic acid export membrane protein